MGEINTTMKNNVVFSGNLDFLSLAEIFQLLGANTGCGVLRLISEYASEPAFVYFVKGNMINASNHSSTGLDALYSLFGWTEGTFEFSQEDVKIKKVINKNRMEIILDGLRMLDDGLIEKLGTGKFKKKLSEDISKTETELPIIKGPLVDYLYVVDEEDFVAGDKIIEEGKHGSWIWVILKGTVDIVKESSQGPVTISRIGEGAFLGSLDSLLTRNSKRSANAIAAGNVQLGVLDSQSLSREYSCMSHEFRDFVIILDKRLKEVTNKTIEIYNKDIELKHFINSGKTVIKQGESLEGLFIIKQGKASVVRHTKSGHVLLTQLDKGDFFGHLPFLDMGHEPYSASVFGSEDLEIKTLDSDNLRREYENLSTTFKNILENLANCIAATSVLACEFKKKTS
ncbi:MAG: cyclic nucleotide-binding domain-containing protein [Deltaproteobacteria bacterium]|nr:cyclic nucleotide-binding domain-containing protein [Deltaproteobacteria bacterium]